MSQQPSLLVLQDWLDSYLNFEVQPKKNIFWLETMEFLCKRFNNPQNSFKSIHVAGSKGKGSVSTMIASILETAGVATGLYTSPHITDFSERIGGATVPYNESIYEAATKEIMHSVDAIIPEQLPANRPITWFELVTLFSFLCFKEAKAQWVVLETGLGGRLDATNVVIPEMSVITPIELEHIEFLGNTIEKIATEKAGIIKKEIPVCVAPQMKTALDTIICNAKKANSQLFYEPEYIKHNEIKTTHKGTKLVLQSQLFSRPIKTTLKLFGSVQVQNAGLAAMTTKLLFENLNEKDIEEGLAKATLPGRFEIVGTEDAPIILDGAHTEKSISITLQTFDLLYGNYKEKHLLFACAADKDVENISKLFKNFNQIITTRPGEHKESDPARMETAFKKSNISHQFIYDYKEAISYAVKKAQQAKAALLVVGSFYLVAEFKAQQQ